MWYNTQATIPLVPYHVYANEHVVVRAIWTVTNVNHDDNRVARLGSHSNIEVHKTSLSPFYTENSCGAKKGRIIDCEYIERERTDFLVYFLVGRIKATTTKERKSRKHNNNKQQYLITTPKPWSK